MAKIYEAKQAARQLKKNMEIHKACYSIRQMCLGTLSTTVVRCQAICNCKLCFGSRDAGKKAFGVTVRGHIVATVTLAAC